MTFILMMFTEDYDDNKLVSFYIILLFIWFIAILYNVNSKFYYMFLVIYIFFVLVSSYLYRSYEKEELKLFNTKAKSNNKK